MRSCFRAFARERTNAHIHNTYGFALYFIKQKKKGKKGKKGKKKKEKKNPFR